MDTCMVWEGTCAGECGPFVVNICYSPEQDVKGPAFCPICGGGVFDVTGKKVEAP